MLAAIPAHADLSAAAKTFNPASIPAGGTSTLTVTLTNNPPGNPASIAFTDNYPAGLKNAPTPNLTNTCNGTATGSAGQTSLTLSGGSKSGSGSCAVSIVVTACAAGSYTNPGFLVSSTRGSVSTSPTSLVVTASIPTAVNSMLSASPGTIPADGVTTSTISVTLRDGCDNPVAGKTVSLAAGAGSSIISPASAVSNASGVATFTVKNSVAEVVTYTATDTTDAIVIGQVQVTFATTGPSGPNHYELWLPTNSVACLGATVSVVACADASSPCTNKMAAVGGTTATLATSAGTLAANPVVFDATGVASTTLSYPGAADGASVSVTLQSVQLGAANPNKWCPDGSACVVANSGATTFNTAGFIVAAAAGGAETTVSTQVAGASSATYVLRAVKTNSSTQACEAALSGATQVNFGYECNNPTTCYAGNLMSVNGGAATTIARNDNGGVSSYLPVTMIFDAGGNAPFTFSYSDVGLVRIWMNKTAGGSLHALLAGSSNSFVVKPGGFLLSNIKQTAAPQTVNPAAANAAGAKFVKAGESFSATVSATTTPASGSSVTPNYGRELSPEGVKLTMALVAPAGGATGSFSGSFGAFSNGQANGTGFNWSEVGIISLTPSVGDGDYLGAGDTSGTNSGNIGRFYPDHFDTVVTSQGAPTAFAYSGNPAGPVRGQPFSVAVTARNAAGTAVSNYSYGGGAGYAKSVNLTAPVGAAFGQIYIDSVAGGTGAIPASKFTGAVPGEGKVLYSDASGRISFVFNSLPQAPQAIQLHAEDADSVSSAGANGGISIRQGRLRLFNAFGSEKADLGLPLRAEYWSGNAWVTNGDDSFTTVPAASVALAAYSGSLSDPANFGASHVSAATLVNGQANLMLAKPSPAATGSVDLAINLGSTATDQSCLSAHPATTGAGLPWLRSINGNCAATYDRDPSARASFGIYAPETRKTIHTRELF